MYVGNRTQITFAKRRLPSISIHTTKAHLIFISVLLMKSINFSEVLVFIDIRGLRLSLKFCVLTLTRRLAGNIKLFHIFNRCRIILPEAPKAQIPVADSPITVRLVRWTTHQRTSYFTLAVGFLVVPIVGGIICIANRKYTMAVLLGFA